MRQTKFKKIVNVHKDLIYSQAYYFTGNKEDAEDISQEVLIKLWHHFKGLKKNAVKAWLLTVTRNLCIDYNRKKREILLDDSKDESENIVWETLADPQSNPEKEAINSDLLENITRIINKLPEKMRSIVIMRDIQDLQYSLIAEIMDLPLNSVKVNLHRGRKLLSEKLMKNYKHDLLGE